MLHNVVLKQMNTWEIPFGAHINNPSDTVGHMQRILALYPQIIRTQDEYAAIKKAMDEEGTLSVQRCVFVASETHHPYVVFDAIGLPDDIEQACELGRTYDVIHNRMGQHGISIHQLMVPGDSRRSWVVDQLQQVYASHMVSGDEVEAFLSDTLPVITVAVFDERIIAAGMAKVSQSNRIPAWKHIDVLGPATLPKYTYPELYPAMWREMMESVRTFCVS